MKIDLETIIELVTREVIKELHSRGYSIEQLVSDSSTEVKVAEKSVEIDMSGFVTPIVTEGTMEQLEKGVEELIIPPQTIITPGASRLIKMNNIKLIYKS